jgi:hypothetical protein
VSYLSSWHYLCAASILRSRSVARVNGQLEIDRSMGREGGTTNLVRSLASASVMSVSTQCSPFPLFLLTGKAFVLFITERSDAHLFKDQLNDLFGSEGLKQTPTQTPKGNEKNTI